MRPIEVACPRFGPVRFLGAQLNGGHDFALQSNCTARELDLLFFFDSRGISAEFAGSLAERALLHVGDRRRWLLVCRPLELTTWATLGNFLRLNELRPNTLITNMGFVDFTPKKRSILEDAVRQVEVFTAPGTAIPHPVERYVASTGEEIDLFAMTYADAYRRGIEQMARNGSLVVLNTPPVSPGIRIQRHRPSSFFAGIGATNEFNRSIQGATVLSLPRFDETQTYDAVHYTAAGNELMFAALRGYLST